KTLADRHASQAGADRFLSLLKHAVVASAGDEATELTLLGFKPKKKPAELTPEQKQHRVEQMRATRAARHTMGKRQKQAVKGVVSSKKGGAGSPAAPSPGRTT